MPAERSFTEVYEHPRDGEPVYRVAEMLPRQGMWSVERFLMLDDDDCPVELVNGRVEMMPMTTEEHQDAQNYLYVELLAYCDRTGAGKPSTAGIRVRMVDGNVRLPDIVFMKAEHQARRNNRYWDGADLVMEIVSEDDSNRDWEEKFAEYAASGVTEYWIIDPRDRTVTVFALDASTAAYCENFRGGVGTTARSALLDGFEIAVSAIFGKR
ncbi:Uma2 family endonuclease [Stratiformator vulcanicus]|uniref:Putative restriction endonuclease domain-containing protein n=1 Tax=Stratiformator vulcanicus TaxID=2527980 RepID=A0A517R7W6_9PLAN|nr:Uma2 family endonuclease [Stratiformator vulcanicus]QDT39923.1 hypothetical protein Pan189_43350 [Stratiformator vulcanicus]